MEQFLKSDLDGLAILVQLLRLCYLAKKAVHANAVTPQQILALTQLGEKKKKRYFQSIADIPKADNGTLI